MGMGHVGRCYETVDQRFLGDEEFIEEVEQRAAKREIQVKGPRIAFGQLLQAVPEEPVDRYETGRDGQGGGSNTSYQNVMRTRTLINLRVLRRDEPVLISWK